MATRDEEPPLSQFEEGGQKTPMPYDWGLAGMVIKPSVGMRVVAPREPRKIVFDRVDFGTLFFQEPEVSKIGVLTHPLRPQKEPQQSKTTHDFVSDFAFGTGQVRRGFSDPGTLS